MRRMTPAPILSALFSVLLLVGCVPSDEGQETTAFRDSAGVVLATAAAPAWAPAEGWHVSNEPMVEIGRREGSDDYTLSAVSGVVRLGDGRIVVADRRSLDLRFYSPTGEFLSRSGGEGEGPGEFRSLDFLGLLPGDTLLTFDGRLRRMQLFDPSGTFLRSLPPVKSAWPEFNPVSVIGVLDGHRIAMMFNGVGTEVPSGTSRWPPEMAVALDLATGAADSIVVAPGQEASVTPREGGGFGYYSLPFGIRSGFAVRAGRVAVISTETIGASVYSAGAGLEQIFRRPVPATPVTQEDFEAFVERFVQSPRFQGRAVPGRAAQLRQLLEGNPRGDTWPELRSVDFDAEGNLWLELSSKRGNPPAPYDVVSPKGVWLGQVTLPPDRQRCFQFGADYVLGVWTDQLDVPYVRMYALEK